MGRALERRIDEGEQEQEGGRRRGRGETREGGGGELHLARRSRALKVSVLIRLRRCPE